MDVFRNKGIDNLNAVLNNGDMKELKAYHVNDSSSADQLDNPHAPLDRYNGARQVVR